MLFPFSFDTFLEIGYLRSLRVPRRTKIYNHQAASQSSCKKRPCPRHSYLSLLVAANSSRLGHKTKVQHQAAKVASWNIDSTPLRHRGMPIGSWHSKWGASWHPLQVGKSRLLPWRLWKPTLGIRTTLSMDLEVHLRTSEGG